MDWIILIFLFLNFKNCNSSYLFIHTILVLYVRNSIVVTNKISSIQSVSLPVAIQQKGLTYSYVGFTKKFIFSDPLRQHYGKLTANELTGYFHPNEFSYVFREEISVSVMSLKWIVKQFYCIFQQKGVLVLVSTDSSS
jgi:hypothetical protein